MSSQFPVKHLCDVLDINRSGFYKWKKRLEKPSDKLKTLVSNLILFKEYHSKYPSHGYSHEYRCRPACRSHVQTR